MSWTNIAQTERDLSTALNAFDWKGSSEVDEGLIVDIGRESELLPERASKSILGKLRRKRRLDLMTRLAEALIHSGQIAFIVQRQYAQALIDQGCLNPAERMLEHL